jgi:UrcA family protein
MTFTIPALRHSGAALVAAAALMTPMGFAAAQSAYQAQITYPAPPQVTYEPPVTYQPQVTYAPAPAYQPQVTYAPAPAYQPQVAYPPAPAYQTREEMTIIAPGVQHWTVGRSGTGIPIEELSLSRTVDIRDLDLSRWDDVQTLNYRVRQAAFAACNELDREYPQSMYPSYPSGDDNCVARATDEGMAQARLAVAQASAYPMYPR